MITGTAVPRATVVVLSHDRPDLLERALRSIHAQTCPGLEVIVIETKATPAPASARSSAGLPGFSLISNDDNRGFTGGMNQGSRRPAARMSI